MRFDLTQGKARMAQRTTRSSSILSRAISSPWVAGSDSTCTRSRRNSATSFPPPRRFFPARGFRVRTLARGHRKRVGGKPFMVAFFLAVLLAGDDWLQFKSDARHSGNVPDRVVTTPLGLAGAVPLSDAVFSSPVHSAPAPESSGRGAVANRGRRHASPHGRSCGARSASGLLHQCGHS